MLSDRVKIAELLLDLECVMRQRNLWASVPPPAQGYTSQVPFAADCWSLAQWLQFLFIPKIRTILAQNQALPEKCSIAPMVMTPGCGLGEEMACLSPILKALDEAIEQAP